MILTHTSSCSRAHFLQGLRERENRFNVSLTKISDFQLPDQRNQKG
jgi:hypothetical protein